MLPNGKLLTVLGWFGGYEWRQIARGRDKRTKELRQKGVVKENGRQKADGWRLQKCDDDAATI